MSETAFNIEIKDLPQRRIILESFDPEGRAYAHKGTVDPFQVGDETVGDYVKEIHFGLGSIERLCASSFNVDFKATSEIFRDQLAEAAFDTEGVLLRIAYWIAESVALDDTLSDQATAAFTGMFLSRSFGDRRRWHAHGGDITIVRTADTQAKTELLKEPASGHIRLKHPDVLEDCDDVSDEEVLNMLGLDIAPFIIDPLRPQETLAIGKKVIHTAPVSPSLDMVLPRRALLMVSVTYS